jgi:hypothetical protein
MVYLVKEDNEIKVYIGKRELPKGVTPGKEVTDEEYHAAGGYVRVIGGEIVVGLTPEETAESEREMRRNECVQKLAEIDREAGAGRAVRGVAFKAGKKAGMSTDEDDPDYDEDYERLCGYEARAEEEREKIKALKGGRL